MHSQKTISEFLSNEYRDFSLYVIENRAIASVVDGLKPVQRKILHVSNRTWRLGSEKTLKVFQLCGKVASEAFYHHGDASLSAAIVNLAQSFKNNLPLMEEDGQFGSLRVPEAGAPRYIGTRLHPNFRLVYKDFDLLSPREEEGEVIEPEYFLPVVPMILVNGSSGIAVGFSSNIMGRDPLGVIAACEAILKGKRVPLVSPMIPGFRGTFAQDPDNHKRWIISGAFQRANTSTIRITELPPSMTLEKYEQILDDLVDKKSIASYENNCRDTIDFVVKMTRESLAAASDQDLVKMLRLEEYRTEIFCTLDESGKLKIFESSEELTRYFVEFRLSFYDKRKALLIAGLEREIGVLSNRARFIKSIVDGELEVRNAPRDSVVARLESMSFDRVDSSFDYLLRMPIWSLTQEQYEKLLAELEAARAELERTRALEPVGMYLSDLSELRKKLK